MRTATGLAVVAAGLAVALAGCGGGEAEPGIASAGGQAAASTAAAAADAQPRGEERRRQFAQCMRDNGVDLPDPEPGSGRLGRAGANIDRDSPAFQQAREACREFAPSGGDLAKANPELMEQMRRFTQCMRDNGVDLPDPDPNAPGLGLGGIAKDVDRDSPAFQQALEACRDELPQRRGNR